MAFDEDKFARYGLLAGVAAVVLMLVGGFIAGSPPKLTEPKKIADYFTDNRDAIRIGSYLTGLSGLVFLWFLGSLYGKLRSVEGGTGRLSRVALTGGIVAVALVFVGNAITAEGALHATDPGGGLGAIGSYRTASVFFSSAMFGIAAYLVGTALVLWTKGVLPKWFGYAGEAAAVLALVAAGGLTTENDTIFIVGFVAFLAFAIWTAALSVMLYRQDA